MDLLDPLGLVNVSRFVKAHATFSDVVIQFELGTFAYVGVQGDPERSRGLLRAMISELAVFNGPDVLQIAAIVSDPDDPKWAWLKWLPHVQRDHTTDALGSGRAIYATVEEFRANHDLSKRGSVFLEKYNKELSRLLVLVDVPEESEELATYEQLTWLVNQPAAMPAGRPTPDAVFQVDSAGELVDVDDRGRTTPRGHADTMDVETAAIVARLLARYRVDASILGLGDDSSNGAVRDTSWAGLQGIRDPGAINTQDVWKRHRPDDRDRLAIPLGRDSRGRPVILDLKESAQRGMGPHGMLIGFTGSGKSELLSGLVLSAATRHSPDELNMLLIDYKGGPTFSGMNALNHVLAVITNMEQEQELVDRLVDVLDGELERRSALLREWGERTIGRTFPNVSDYENFRQSPRGQAANMPPIPALLVVIDEFTELLTQKQDFAEAAVRIGRLGRSLGLHLLLATQRYNEGQARGLETHFSYRIALKTTSSADSRAVIGVPDAFHLPKDSPGAGYLKAGADDPVQFQAPWTGGRYVPVAPDIDDDSVIIPRDTIDGYARPRLFTAAAQIDESVEDTGESGTVIPDELVVLDTADESDDPWGDENGLRDNTVRGVVLNQLAGKGLPSRQMWLPSINAVRTLDEVLAMYQARRPQRYVFPLGLVDDPRQHAQHPWLVNTNVGGGHVALAGGTGMGKSTAVTTMVLSAAATHSPELVQFYIVDSGGVLGQLKELPHVGAVARDHEHMRRVLSVIMSIIESRQVMFSDLQIHSLDDFRARREAGDPEVLSRDAWGDVYLVLDGYEALAERENLVFYEDRDKFATIVSTGGSFGVHLMVTSNAWLRVNMRESIMTRMELRLGETFNAEVNREVARSLPSDIPGRATIQSDDLARRVSLPRLDGVAEASTIRAATAAAVESIADLYRENRPAERIDVLPRKIDITEILAASPINSRTPLRRRLQVPFAISEASYAPIAVDFMRSAHMVVYGAAKSGKSTALAAVVKSIVARTSTAEAMFVLVDPRRQHMDLLGEDRLINTDYLSTQAQIGPCMEEIAALLKRREPVGKLTPQERRERSWWTGPEIFVVVDDLHMAASSYQTVFDPIIPALSQGTDIGFHVILARAMQGAGTAINMPLLSAVKSMASSGLLLDGDRLEGLLIDAETRPVQQRIRGRGIFVAPTDQINGTVQVGWTDLPQE